MKYKLIALDLDGTLVDKKNKFSSININYLVEFTKNGGILCFVTGRPLNSALNLYSKIKEKNKDFALQFIFALNGSLIYDVQNQKILKSIFIEIEYVKKVLQICKKNNLIFSAYSFDSINKNKMNIFNFYKFIKIFLKKKNFFNFDFFSLKNIYKINVVRKYKKKNFLNANNEIDKINEFLSISKTSRVMSEITAKNIDKGFAIDQICNLLNLNYSDIVAIGDSANDIPMFKKAGLALAVNQKKLKRHNFADCIFLDKKTKNAISFAIKQYIF